MIFCQLQVLPENKSSQSIPYIREGRMQRGIAIYYESTSKGIIMDRIGVESSID